MVRQPAGSLNVNSDSLGGYATYIGGSGWYLDAVAVYGWHDLRLTSRAAERVELEGESGALSLEAGFPLRVGRGWVVEPQAQIIWQKSKLDQIDDPLSTVQFESRDDLIGRIGVRRVGCEYSSLKTNRQRGTWPVNSVACRWSGYTRYVGW